jgi:hypothetical protein
MLARFDSRMRLSTTTAQAAGTPRSVLRSVKLITQAGITADQRAPNVVPALIADLGDEAAWRYVEFFTANIRNPNTRRAYARSCARFFAWCDDRGLMPAAAKRSLIR